MTNAPVLGQWLKAPLALVLAQIRFEPLLDIEAISKAFQEKVEVPFPRLLTAHRLPFPMGGGEAASMVPSPQLVAFDFLNASRTKSIRLESNALTFSVTEYVKYDGHFETEWGQVVEALSSLKRLFVTRLGLRYVDFILPTEGALPSDYVVPPLGQALEIEGGQPKGQYSMVDYKMSQGALRIQYFQQAGQPLLPPDLQGPLEPPTLTFDRAEDLTAILDTDRMIDVSDHFSHDEIMSSFSSMHSDLSGTFKRIITERAKKEWNTPDQGG
jgi:uncharacterized protein (TIGR04255 family)